MMENLKFYEIDEALASCFDSETGEILDEDKFNELTAAKDEKIQGVGLMIKSRDMLIANIDEEMKRLRDRKETLKNMNEGTKEFLKTILNGQKFETEKVRISFRKSKAVEIEDELQIPDGFIKETVKRAPDKTAIKEALQKGETVPGCVLRENNNLSIK